MRACPPWRERSAAQSNHERATGATVLANSSVQVLMRQDSSTIDVVSQTFRLSSGEREFLLACQ